MPQQNGRIYRDPNATPHALGISLDDIGLCIGLGSRELGTLCQGMDDYETEKVYGVSTNPYYCDSNQYHGSIKAWSKAKPVFFTGPQSFLGPDNVNDVTLHEAWEERRKGNEDGSRTNPYDENNYPFKMAYGIEIPTGKELFGTDTTSGGFISSSGKVAPIDAQTAAKGGWIFALLTDGKKVINTDVVTLRWRYEPPLSGAALVPFRVLDFDEYIHNAVNPMPLVPNDTIGLTKPGSSSNTFSIPITASLPPLPSHNGLFGGNISFGELSDVIAERNITGEYVEVTTWQTGDNPKALNYYEKNGDDYSATTDTARNVNKRYYRRKGLKDMYLCAVLYYTVWSGQHEDSISITYCLWGSSNVTYPESGWDTVPFSVTVGSDIIGISKDEFWNILIAGYDPADVAVNGDKGWNVKFFWCTKPIGILGVPQEPYTLIRGNDTPAFGQRVRFVDLAENGAPIAHINSSLSVHNDGVNNIYRFEAYIQNVTEGTLNFNIRVLAYADGDKTEYIEELGEKGIFFNDEYGLPTNSMWTIGPLTPYPTDPDGPKRYTQIEISTNDTLTDFLILACYSDEEITAASIGSLYEQGKVCGVLMKPNGIAITFGEKDPLGNTLDFIQEQYGEYELV